MMNGSSVLLSLARDRFGRRHNLCGPLDGIRVSAILKNDSLADYLVEYGRLRRLDDALHWMRFSVRDSATTKLQPGPSPFHRWNLRLPCTLDLIVGAAEGMNGRVWRRHDQLPLHPVQPIPRGSAPHWGARRKSLRAQPSRPARPKAQTA